MSFKGKVDEAMVFVLVFYLVLWIGHNPYPFIDFRIP